MPHWLNTARIRLVHEVNIYRAVTTTICTVEAAFGHTPYPILLQLITVLRTKNVHNKKK